MAKKLPPRDPKQDSWPWESARRAVVILLRRVRYRLQRERIDQQVGDNVKRIGQEPPHG